MEEVTQAPQYRYEKNICLQPFLIGEALGSPRPSWMDELKRKRIYFIGIGTSFYAAQISKSLWRQHVSPEAEAVHSFDFVRIPQPIRRGDVAVFFSHSGKKSFSLQAAELARKAKAITVGITCKASPWQGPLTYRIETCEREDTGAFTKSLTSALAWIIRWIGDAKLSQGVRRTCERLEHGPDLPKIRAATDLILIGDAVREWVAREVALKVQETSYTRARPFGLEEFLHGPRVSAGQDSLVIGFSARTEERWQSVRGYLKTAEVPLLEVQAEDFKIPLNAGWLWQLFWGQRLALEICRQVGVDPDTLRTQDPRYKKAREQLTL